MRGTLWEPSGNGKETQRRAGWVVEFGSTLGRLVIGNSVTDASGRVSVVLHGEGTPGVAVVTARLGGRSEQAEVRVGIPRQLTALSLLGFT